MVLRSQILKPLKFPVIRAIKVSSILLLRQFENSLGNEDMGTNHVTRGLQFSVPLLTSR